MMDENWLQINSSLVIQGCRQIIWLPKGLRGLKRLRTAGFEAYRGLPIAQVNNLPNLKLGDTCCEYLTALNVLSLVVLMKILRNVDAVSKVSQSKLY